MVSASKSGNGRLLQLVWLRSPTPQEMCICTITLMELKELGYSRLVTSGESSHCTARR